ncbi:Polyketide cyclase / dehydrase and lipid transport [Anatilimnocola aggregata]|uniref:Polyketide cyclase / dehydrase and lipid transport n=1 Tax=Anatilimnocola aggregata TaxID=2528021 RepID=A0A517YBA5_9BACT|nr:SRPBCC family protein [Anatilimnocola aggregata]QDU27536.1 Polyketide cyclase / dehydrase and lipid transport [Anatilimnocola aggregata]
MLTHPVRNISVSIDCSAARVYRFVSDPRNLPQWATAFCKSVREEQGDWIISTPEGEVQIRFAAANELGVLDHVVMLAPGVEVHVPMRVITNGAGSEVLFTLFQLPSMSAAKFAEDAGLVERDLNTLKRVLEENAVA